MKKTLVKAFAICASVFLAGQVFAGTVGHSSVGSLSEALQQRTTFLKKPTMAADTFIIVINYTNNYLYVTFPDGTRHIGPNVSAWYSVGGTSYYNFPISNPNGVFIQNIQAQGHDVVSVYLSGGKYVIYNSPVVPN